MRAGGDSLPTAGTSDPAAWLSGDFPDRGEFDVDLSGLRRDLDGIVAAIRRNDWHLGDLRAGELPVECLADAARSIRTMLGKGRGFCTVSGIAGPATMPDEAAMLYWLLGNAIGQPMPQNKAGDRLGVVEDRSHVEAQLRGYRTREALTFHTDVADIVGLLGERVARSGGETCIASALTIHDIMRTERPELLDRLYRGYHYDRAGEGGAAGEVTETRIPVFSRREQRISARLYRPLAELGTRKAGLDFTEDDAEAFDLLETIARRDGVMLRFQIEPGEILLLNNYTILHARTSFEDFPEIARKRKLLRLWLRVPGFRPVDPAIRLH